MKSKWIIASILILVLIALCGASLFAVWTGLNMVQTSGVRIRMFQTDAVKAEAVEEQTLSVEGPASLTLNNDFGDVDVESGADGQIYIKAEKTAWGSNDADARRALSELKVIVEQRGDEVSVSVQRPEEVDVFSLESNSPGVRFTLVVPAETEVSLDSMSGSLSLSGVTGEVNLQTDFGDIALAEVNGKATARSNSGTISAENVTSEDDVLLTSEFGEVHAQGIRALNVSIDSTNGPLYAQDIAAGELFKASSDFGAISVAKLQAAEVEVDSSNGAITLEDVTVEGEVSVQCDFADLTLSAVDAGGYSLKTLNGAIKLDGAHGSISAHSDFGNIEAKNVVSGTLDLASTNGSVTFSGSLAAGPHSVSTDFGNVTLSLPPDSALNVDLQTDFGNITSDFEITVSGALEASHWIGKFNGGGEELTVKTKNGHIVINAR